MFHKALLQPVLTALEDTSMLAPMYQLFTIKPTQFFHTFHSQTLTLLFVQKPCQITINDHMISCFAGNIIAMNLNNRITISSEDACDTSAYVIALHFKKNYFTHTLLAQLSDCPMFYDLLKNKSNQREHLMFDCEMADEIQIYASILLSECMITHKNPETTVNYAFLLFMTNLHRIHCQSLVISESIVMSDCIISQMLQYMSDHYRDITLSQLAQQFSFHPSYLSVMFKNLSGYTFSEKLLMIKLEHAKRMLLTTDLSVQAIVEMIGFKEKSYFHKMFKHYYETTPAKYRKENRKNH